MLTYLKNTYGSSGTTIHLSNENGSLSESYIYSQMQGKQGIYVIISVVPYGSNSFGASGHVDILNSDGTFASGHSYYYCNGGVKDVYLFILNN